MSCVAPCPRIETLDEKAFSALAPEWDELLQRSYDNRIFYTPLWHELWWEHFGADHAHVLTLRNDEGVLEAVLPLQITSRDGERVLSLVGDFNVSDYMDGVTEKQQAESLLKILWETAFSDLQWDRLDLRHVPASSPLVPALRAVIENEGMEVSVEDDEVCPVAILCSSWDGYLQMLSKKQRHEIRRKMRRCQEGARLGWRTAKTLAELERDLPVFFRLHEASAHDKARFMTENMREFFRAMSATLLDKGILRLSVLQRNGTDIATTMSFLHRQRYLLYNSGYDPAHSAYSPGIAAVALTMQDAIGEKAVALDFLSGNEPYKYQFGASNTHTCRITTQSKS